MRCNLQSKLAFKEAICDSKRDLITFDELTSIAWCFRFRKYAGKSWIEWDPWWNEMEPIRIMFEKDGHINKLNYNNEFKMKWRFIRKY